MPEVMRSPGIILGVARFYHDPRGSVRGVLAARPSEANLLLYAMLAAVVLLFGRIVREILLGSQGDALAERISAEVVSLLFFLPLVYYGVAAIGTLLAWLFRGKGSWRDGRTAFFWAALVSAPIVVLSGVGSVSAGAVGSNLGVLVGQIGAVFFAWALAQCYAEAFGFSRSWAVLGVIAAIVGVVMAALYVVTH